jgi:hypothetical protein
MSEQQSQKRGVRSEAQKTTTARSGYDSIPPAKGVAGAFGEPQKNIDTDQELALSKEQRRQVQNKSSETSPTE